MTSSITSLVKLLEEERRARAEVEARGTKEREAMAVALSARMSALERRWVETIGEAIARFFNVWTNVLLFDEKECPNMMRCHVKATPRRGAVPSFNENHHPHASFCSAFHSLADLEAPQSMASKSQDQVRYGPPELVLLGQKCKESPLHFPRLTARLCGLFVLFTKQRGVSL